MAHITEIYNGGCYTFSEALGSLSLSMILGIRLFRQRIDNFLFDSYYSTSCKNNYFIVVEILEFLQYKNIELSYALLPFLVLFCVDYRDNLEIIQNSLVSL